MDRNRYQGVENPSHKRLKQISGKTKMEMGGPGKGVYRMYDHQKKLSSSKPSRSKPNPLVEEFCELTGMSSDKVHLSRSSVSLSKMKEGKARRHRHGIKIKVASPGSASVGAGTTVTRKETRALGETRKSRLNKGKLVFEVDECFGRIVGNDSQHFITKGGCVMRKYAKLDGTTWKKQPESLKTDIISKTTENSNFDSKCSQMTHAMSSQLGYQHRNRQWKLHLLYKEYKTKEEAMTHPPKGIDVSDWVKLCERFASESFQKISIKNKKNRAMNEIPPTVGSHSLARTVDTSRRAGKEVPETKQWKMAHYSEKRNGMINEKADTVWNEIQAEEASSSCTPAEICLKKLGHLPGHIKGRSASTKKILETVNLRSELKVMKESHIKLQEETKATNAKVEFLLEEMKKMSQLLQQFQNRGEI